MYYRVLDSMNKEFTFQIILIPQCDYAAGLRDGKCLKRLTGSGVNN